MKGRDFVKHLAKLTIILLLSLCMISSPLPTVAAQGEIAVRSNSVIYINGQPQKLLQGYTIAGSNYFKLRDIAMALRNQPKSFNVGYDSGVISIAENNNYVPIGDGSELKADATQTALAVPSAANIRVSGRNVSMSAYAINGYTYVKLRDVLEAQGIRVSYVDEGGIITVDSISTPVKTIGHEAKNDVNQIIQRISGVNSEEQPIEYVENQVITQTATLKEAQAVSDAYGGKLISYSENSGIAVIEMTERAEVVRTLKVSADSTSDLPPVFPNRILKIDATASDPRYSSQYFHTDMNVPTAWNTTTGSPGVIVAVIDTGADVSHPDLKDRLSPLSYNSNTKKVGLSNVADTNGHGSHCAGIIAATANNGQGGAGIAPNVTIMAIKANVGNVGSFTSADIVEGIYYAVNNGAHIINMSLGSPYYYGKDTLEETAINYAVSKGVLVVCAAGNESNSHAGYPAALPNAMAVSALRQGNVFDNSYSNYGPEIDVAAPGSNIISTVPNGAYASYSGTSMATPAVCGVAALVKSVNMGLTGKQIRDILRNTATDMGTAGFDNYYGYGAVDAAAAVRAAGGGGGTQPTPMPTSTPTPTSTPKPTTTPTPTSTPRPTTTPTPTPTSSPGPNTLTVRFDSQGGSSVATQYVTYGGRVTVPTPPTRNGYTFECWYDWDGWDWDFDDSVFYNMTLYASWVRNSSTSPGQPKSYTVMFDSDGGSSVPSQTVSSGARATEPTPPTKSGYKFVRWTDYYGYAWDFREGIYHNTTLYAEWRRDSSSGETHTITFDTLGGSYVAPQTVKAGEYGVKPPQNPTLRGYSFMFWVFSDGRMWIPELTPIYSDITLYANWIWAGGY